MFTKGFLLTYIYFIFWVQQTRDIEFYCLNNLFFLTVFVYFNDLNIHLCLRELVCNCLCNFNDALRFFGLITFVANLPWPVIRDLFKLSSWLFWISSFFCCRFLSISFIFFFFNRYWLLSLDLNQIPIFEHASVCNWKCNFSISTYSYPAVFDFVIVAGFMFNIHDNFELTVVSWNIFLLR